METAPVTHIPASELRAHYGPRKRAKRQKRAPVPESALLIATRRCDAWQKAGETLRAAVAWRLYEGKGDILSAMTGVPYAALTRFVETGELDHVHRLILEVSAG